MRNNIKNKILLKIKEYKKIICLYHISPDGDAYGSAFGMANFIKENFPDKTVLVNGEKNKYLNFLTKQHDNILEEDYHNALIIITDTPNIERISSLYWQKGKEIIKIDHHPNITPFGDLQWIDETKISVSELITELLYYSNLKISKKTARLLYTGIITDSNRFLYQKTNSQTLKWASKLLSTGFNLQKIYKNLYQEKLINIQFKAYLLSQLKLTKYGVGYIIVTNKLLIQFKMNYNNVKSWINIMNNIKEIKIWVFFVENKKENYINASIRSNQYIINNIANIYNGGGHKFASGAKIYHWNEIDNIISDLNKIIINSKKGVN